jgi:hypothetical protein
MKSYFKFLFFLVLPFFSISCSQVAPPESVGPVPSERQLAWQELGYYAFIHYNMNTFTNMEWGTGGERPEQFNPTEMDVRQWAKVIKDAGIMTDFVCGQPKRQSIRSKIPHGKMGMVMYLKSCQKPVRSLA